MLLSTKNLNIKNDFSGATKWHHRYVGPFEVISQKVTTVELKLPPGWSGLHPRFHVKLLRPYQGDADRYDEPPPELDFEDIPIYEVEAIVNDRWNGQKKRHEWRVKWNGYAPIHNTWEPLEDLAGASELLREYREKHGESEKKRGRSPTKRGARRK